MSFDVAAESYQRFMGRFSEPLAAALVLATDPQRGWQVLDVGCGPGALTGDLAAWLGEEAVSAIDPSPAFVEAVHRRLPRVDARLGRAEDLPFADASFDASYAQLVVHFMHEPVAGLREMVQVKYVAREFGALPIPVPKVSITRLAPTSVRERRSRSGMSGARWRD